MKKFVVDILSWYKENKRDLPWRESHDPYRIWISEVMLQQTRVEAVISYYYRFLKEVPTIQDLAQIDSDKLMKLWEGLGYYNRARNLKKAAEVIMENYHGQFPTTYEQIIKLPGIGEYTASAIASICFQEKKQAVDGNVLRVFMRYFNDYSNIDQVKTKKRVKQILEDVMPNEAGSFNEGIMELGEVICIPNGAPLCQKCPLKNECLACRNNTYLDLPIKGEKKKKKIYYYTVFLYRYQDLIAIHKRESSNLLSNLWEFPNMEGKLSKRQVQNYCDSHSIKVKEIQKGITNTHVFTHQKWNMTSFLIRLEEPFHNSNYLFLKKETIRKKYAIPTAFHPFLNSIEEED